MVSALVSTTVREQLNLLYSFISNILHIQHTWVNRRACHGRTELPLSFVVMGSKVVHNFYAAHLADARYVPRFATSSLKI